MKTLIAYVLASLVLCAGARAQDAVTLSVIGINDVHGRVEQMPLLGGYVNNVCAARRADGGACLLLDAGDIFQGTLESNLEEGAAMVAAYNALRVHAAALGNHEFDFGPVGERPIPIKSGDDALGALKARVRQARFPMLSANLRNRTQERIAPVPGVRRSVLLHAAGVRVGVIGAMTEAALTATHALNVRELSVLPLAATVAAEAKALRARGAQVVIAVVHAGGECQSTEDPRDLDTCDPNSELFQLARNLPARAVDLLMGGHTHAAVAHEVAGIPTIESLANGQAFGRVDLRIERKTGRVLESKIFEPVRLCKEALAADICVRAHYEGAAVKRDASVIAAIAPYVERAKRAKQALLGVEVVHTVERASAVESPLSNLVADLMLQAFPTADAALNNGGSIRVALPKGALTYGQVFEVFPFDNTFATLHVTGAGLATIVARSLQGGHGIVALAGVRARARCEHGDLVVELFRDSGKPIAGTELLHVVTSDYVATRGDGLVEGVVAQDGVAMHHDHLVRDALVKGLRNYPGGRIDGRDPLLYHPKLRRIEYPGERPVACR